MVYHVPRCATKEKYGIEVSKELVHNNKHKIDIILYSNRNQIGIFDEQFFFLKKRKSKVYVCTNENK